MKSTKNGKPCTNREAICDYLAPLIDSGKFKHSWHVTIDGKKGNKKRIKKILTDKYKQVQKDLKELEIGFELLRRLR